MSEENIKDLLDQAISAIYIDLVVDDYNFDDAEETYDIELTHQKRDKKIRIGFRDVGKKRNFDMIPLYVVNAPLGLIEIFTTFVQVYWDSKENNRTIMESLAAMLTDEMSELDIKIKEEKLVQ
jgi:hypothetical protein